MNPASGWLAASFPPPPPLPPHPSRPLPSAHLLPSPDSPPTPLLCSAFLEERPFWVEAQYEEASGKAARRPFVNGSNPLHKELARPYWVQPLANCGGWPGWTLLS